MHVRSISVFGLALAMFAAPVLRVRAQSTASAASSAPADALADALTAACRQDAASFGPYLTNENAAVYRGLPDEQKTALLKRIVLLEDPGKPLLSQTGEGRDDLECEAGGVTSEMRFGPTQIQDNLAFITLDFPQAAEDAHTVRIGLVREGGKWKLLSVGLLLLDMRGLAQEWSQDAITAREVDAVKGLHRIAEALKAYQTAYGRLPEGLDQLGPADSDGASPDAAGLLDEQLSAGVTPNYAFRYVIVPAGGEADDSERDKASKFELAATPVGYGKTGVRSFYLDADGNLHGADKKGAVATSTDPRVADSAAAAP